jgi:hypothetical protein
MFNRGMKLVAGIGYSIKMHNKPHSLKTRLKISKNPKIVTNWKGGKSNYSSVHKWIVRWYGKAKKCESPDCLGKSKTYDWALVKNTYKKNILNFKQLCRSCHTRLDGNCFQIGHPPVQKGLSNYKDKLKNNMYQSEAQRKFFHSKTGMKKVGGPKVVKEWDESSKGKKLPKKVKVKKNVTK